jgi:hypothetical protein
MKTLINFWHNHVQKTLGWAIGILGGVDLLSLLGNVGHDIVTLVGPIKYATIHLVAGTLIALRAHQASNVPAPLPPPSVPPITQ